MKNSQAPEVEATDQTLLATNNPSPPPPPPPPQYPNSIFYHQYPASAAAFDGFEINGVDQEISNQRRLILGSYDQPDVDEGRRFDYGGAANIIAGAGDHVASDGGELIDYDDQADAVEDEEQQHYIHGIREKDYFDSLPSGFRFEPHDHELILHYLKRKIDDKKLPHNLIKLVNLYEHSPYDVTARYPELGENRWYFFTPRDRKYQNGSRPNRAAGNGFWKATGKDKNIKLNGDHGPVVGFRKALVFYDGRPKDAGGKTNWTMHEYRVNEPSKRVRTSLTDMRLDDYVLCKIIRKPERAYNKTRAGGAGTSGGGGGAGGGGGGGGGGDQTTSISNGGGTSNSNNSDDELEVNSNMRLMINSPEEDKFQYYNSSAMPAVDFPFKEEISSWENPDQYMLNYNYCDTDWEIYNINQAFNMQMPFPELENMLHLDPNQYPNPNPTPNPNPNCSQPEQ